MNRLGLPLLLAIPFLCSAMFGQDSVGQNSVPAAAVADVDGEKISSQDLNAATGESLAALEDQAYRLKLEKLKQLIDDRLLAREAHRRNITLESLISTEITSKAVEVTPQEIHRVYELNKTQLQKPEAEVEGQLRSVLLEQNVATRRHEFAQTLRTNSRVTVYLQPPSPFRAAVDVDGPSRGAAHAVVTIVEFEDFQCPFCKKAQDTVEQVLLRYKDSVRLVHRDFPLQPLHPTSPKAHEAARCADAQGKFWEYRDLLYKNAPATGPEMLTAYASQLNLNAPDFKQCLETGKFKAAIQRDEEEGNRLGVQGTPAFFINGRPLAGAQPESAFSRVIDEELKPPTQR